MAGKGKQAALLSLPFVSESEDTRQSFARDASGLEMLPRCVARPSTVQEVQELLHIAAAERINVTPAGLQSSTTASSISDRGVLLSLRGLPRIHETDTERRLIRAQAGAVMANIRTEAQRSNLLFTPDPTSEQESSIGGAIACNASGARSLLYGPTRKYVQAIKVLLMGGEMLSLRRPAVDKNAVGYPIAQDPVDWFVGSEGTLGVIVEAELSLLPLPAQVIGMAIPFASEALALAFVVAARRSTGINPRCLEFFDEGAMRISQEAVHENPWPDTCHAMVYVEQAFGEQEVGGSNTILDNWLHLAEQHRAGAAEIRVYDSESALDEAREMRHAVPATMNARGAARRQFGGRKVSTDWAVPYEKLADALRVARELAGRAATPQGIAYGHAGNGHPHQNIIAADADELQRVEAVVEATLREVIRMGGTVAAEHGTGKLKRRWLPLQLNKRQISLMQALKKELDPLGLLAPGNLWTDGSDVE